MNTYYVAGLPYSDTLAHHGIKGQKWGIRRFQNEDGSLTEAGRIRYGSGSSRRFDSQGNLTEYGERLKNADLAKARSAYNARYEKDPTLRSTTKGLKNSYYLGDLAKSLGVDYVLAANSRLDDARTKRARNLNPFSADRLYKDMITAEAEAIKIGRAFEANYLRASIDYVNSLPANQRQEALAYVYQFLGFDW